MTCAGLIALAIGHGLVAPEQDKVQDRARIKDPRVRAGLAWISQFLDQPMDKPGKPHFDVLRDPKAVTLYFLWSMERVGVLYGVPKINGKDWYVWAPRF